MQPFWFSAIDFAAFQAEFLEPEDKCVLYNTVTVETGFKIILGAYQSGASSEMILILKQHTRLSN